jgi:hypothetical protein
MLSFIDLIIFEVAHRCGYPVDSVLLVIYFIIKTLSNYVLYRAARNFLGLRLNDNHILIILSGAIFSIIGLLYNKHILAALGIIPTLLVYAQNFIALSREKYDVMKLFLVIGWLGWGVLESRVFGLGSYELRIVLANTLFLVTGMGILGIHLHRIQRERDLYKVEALELSKKLGAIEKLENILLQCASTIEENNDSKQ